MYARGYGIMKKQGIIVGVVLAVLIIAIALAYYMFAAKPEEGAKSIKIDIVHVDGTAKNLEFSTDAEYLLDALKEQVEVEHDGAWVKAVDGYAAIEANQEWWGYTINGNFGQTGMDQAVVKDGDSFEIICNVGYDDYDS